MTIPNASLYSSRYILFIYETSGFENKVLQITNVTNLDG